MNKTEKLREKIAERMAIWDSGCSVHWEKCLDKGQQAVYLEKACQILKACKESGLKFVLKHIADPYDKIEEIEID